MRNAIIAALFAVAVLGLGCGSKSSAAVEDQKAPDKFRVLLDTTKGPVVMEVDRELSQKGADRLYTLVKAKYFDGARFFRVVPNFVVQFGIAADPKLTAKWKDANIPDEPGKISNAAGTVSFATSGPNTRSSQLFINLVDNARLDGMGFTPFAHVVEGMENVMKINSEYGEQPDQKRLEEEGNEYAVKAFPGLDYIKSARVE